MDPTLASKYCEMKGNSCIKTMASSSDSHMLLNSLEIGGNIGLGDLEISCTQKWNYGLRVSVWGSLSSLFYHGTTEVYKEEYPLRRTSWK
jgi:hypothetical protein